MFHLHRGVKDDLSSKSIVLPEVHGSEISAVATAEKGVGTLISPRLPSPTVAKKAQKKVKCPDCGKSYARLKAHMDLAHPVFDADPGEPGQQAFIDWDDEAATFDTIQNQPPESAHVDLPDPDKDLGKKAVKGIRQIGVDGGIVPMRPVYINTTGRNLLGTDGSKLEQRLIR